MYSVYCVYSNIICLCNYVCMCVLGWASAKASPWTSAYFIRHHHPHYNAATTSIILIIIIMMLWLVVHCYGSLSDIYYNASRIRPTSCKRPLPVLTAVAEEVFRPPWDLKGWWPGKTARKVVRCYKGMLHTVFSRSWWVQAYGMCIYWISLRIWVQEPSFSFRVWRCERLQEGVSVLDNHQQWNKYV